MTYDEHHHTTEVPIEATSRPAPRPSAPSPALGRRGDPTDALPVATVGTEPVVEQDAIARLERRMNLMVGTLGMLLIAAFVVIGLLLDRVADAERNAEVLATGASSEQIGEIQADLERVEAGAALYASQIDGFREQLVELSPEIEEGVDEAILGLRDFSQSTIAFDVAIDETIPVDTEVVINRTVEVPIQTEIPISQEIDTTIEVDTPFGAVPLDITVPVDVVVPVDLVVDIPIDETVPITDEFPVQMTVPIEIDVGDTELANLTESLAAGLESLQEVLTGLS